MERKIICTLIAGLFLTCSVSQANAVSKKLCFSKANSQGRFKVTAVNSDKKCPKPFNYGAVDIGAASTTDDGGEVGPAGAQGPQGPVGPQGPQGEQGPIGLTGAKGDAGPQGETGAQGEVGAKGDKGETGPQGLQGEQGIQGEQGVEGEVGPQGIQGVQGETGPVGPQGEAGLVNLGSCVQASASRTGSQEETQALFCPADTFMLSSSWEATKNGNLVTDASTVYKRDLFTDGNNGPFNYPIGLEVRMNGGLLLGNYTLTVTATCCATSNDNGGNNT